MSLKPDKATSLKIAPHDMWSMAVNKNYPMVAWSLPQSNTSFLLIDTRPELEMQEHNLEEVKPGFLVNSFLSSHPCKSILLKADVLIIREEEQHRTELNPVLSASHLDQFLQDIQDNSDQIEEHTPLADVAKSYTKLVKEAVDKITNGNAQKIVLARYEDHEIPPNLDFYRKFEELNHLYPNAMTYACYLPGEGVWLGATPEELIELKGNKHFKTVALAGTQPLPEGAKLSDLTWTQKEIEEQALVSRYIIDCFKKIRLREFDEHGPRTVKAGQMAHLKTQFHVDMEATHSPRLGTTMLNLLQPTSAVCGMPLAKSLAFIRENEGFDRGFYSGFLGPVRIKDNTNLFVNLRCARLKGNLVRFYAGAGITEDSNPEKELIETDLKLKTMKRVILNA